MQHTREAFFTLIGLFLTYLIERTRRLLKRTTREKESNAAKIVSAVDVNVDAEGSVGLDGNEGAQGNENVDNIQRKNLTPFLGFYMNDNEHGRIHG